MAKKYTSTKNYDHLGSIAYRQWRADSHCNRLHGYSLSFRFFFEVDELDVRRWAVDYGSLRTLKEKLEEWFDHTLLVAEDDPQKADLLRLRELRIADVVVVSATGCEAIADFLMDYITDIWLKDNGYADRVRCTKIEVRETPSNMAFVTQSESGDRQTNIVG